MNESETKIPKVELNNDGVLKGWSEFERWAMFNIPEWREARRLYERVLELWPSDPESPAHHLFAGEASAKLEDYPSAVAHLDAAAAGGPDSIAGDARLQRVGVTDAWYERTRAASGAKGLGSDSLANAFKEKGMPYDYRVIPGPHDQPWLREAGTIETLYWLDRLHYRTGVR